MLVVEATRVPFAMPVPYAYIPAVTPVVALNVSTFVLIAVAADVVSGVIVGEGVGVGVKLELVEKLTVDCAGTSPVSAELRVTLVCVSEATVAPLAMFVPKAYMPAVTPVVSQNGRTVPLGASAAVVRETCVTVLKVIVAPLATVPVTAWLSVTVVPVTVLTVVPPAMLVPDTVMPVVTPDVLANVSVLPLAVCAEVVSVTDIRSYLESGAN